MASKAAAKIPPLLQKAFAALQSGALAEAERLCAKALDLDPRHADALHLGGVVAAQCGKAERALQFLEKAERAQPRDPDLLSDLGGLLLSMGRHEQAEPRLRNALAARPHHLDARIGLGNALLAGGRFAEAAEEFRRASSQAPGHPGICANLAVALERGGKFAEAEQALRDALRAHPGEPMLHLALGRVLESGGEPWRARRAWDAALALDSTLVEAHCGRARLFREAGDPDRAETSYADALRLDPNGIVAASGMGDICGRQARWADAELWYRRALALDPLDDAMRVSLANVLVHSGKLDEALPMFEVLLQRHPLDLGALDGLAAVRRQQRRFLEMESVCREALRAEAAHAPAWSSLGLALGEQGRLTESLDAFAEACRLDADSAASYLNLGTALLALGRIEQAIASMRRAVAFAPGEGWVHSPMLFALQYAAGLAPEAVFREHLLWWERHAVPLAAAAAPRAPQRAGRRLRVGFVGGDFRQHSVAFFVEPALARHDRGAFEVSCYSTSSYTDAVTERLKGYAGRWVDIAGLSDEQAAARIREDRIDILVDLAGHTANNRLLVFARRPAPVQVTWIGYGDTTGMRQMDWRITDAIADPPGATEGFHTESLLRLDGCFCCYQPPADAPLVAPAPVARSGRITFGCFNNPSKVGEAVIDLWSRVLQAVPGSRLMIKGKGLGEPADRRRFTERFAHNGIGLERVVFSKQEKASADHLGRYAEVDVALDCFPYNGVTTTCEALWMGVPVVALAGRKHIGRTGATLLHHAGFPEWIAASEDEYLSIAVRLASDAEALARLRSRMREHLGRSPLLDAEAHARDVERALLRAWDSFERGDARPGPLPAQEKTALVALPGPVQVAVPDTLEQLTPYILREQGDWFEDEIAFVRRLLAPGMTALDVGANVGVYALSMALTVESAGHVWAFEPAARAASLLRESVAANGFTNVSVVQAALSDRGGRMSLAQQWDATDARLTDSEDDCAGEVVDVLRLDDLLDEFGGRRVDFVKVDAEGLEAAVLRGGAEFLRAHAPLLMLEVKHGAIVNDDMLAEAQRLGLHAYVLVPGLGLLRPMSVEDADEPFRLNMFCCGPERAQALEARGLLAAAPGPAPGDPLAGGWRDRLAVLPYARLWAGGAAAGTGAAAGEEEHLRGIGLYLASCAEDMAPGSRLDCLERAFRHCAAAVGQAPTLLRLSSLIRVARDSGRRMRAFAAAGQGLDVLAAGGGVSPGPDESFLATDASLERLDPGGRAREWMEANLLQARETLGVFSSFYGSGASLRRLERIEALGFMAPAMLRRLDLLRRRFRLDGTTAGGAGEAGDHV